MIPIYGSPYKYSKTVLVEHTIYLVQTVWNFELKLEKYDVEIEDKWKQYFLNEYGYFFEVLPYNWPLSILIFVRKHFSLFFAI